MLVLMIHVDHSTHGWLATLCLWHSWCFLGLGAFPFTHGFIQRNLQGALQQLETFAERIRRGLRQLQFQTVSLSKTKTGESCSHACMMFCIGLTYKVVSLYIMKLCWKVWIKHFYMELGRQHYDEFPCFCSWILRRNHVLYVSSHFKLFMKEPCNMDSGYIKQNRRTEIYIFPKKWIPYDASREQRCQP